MTALLENRSSTPINRRGAGIGGGQFAPSTRSEAIVDLSVAPSTCALCAPCKEFLSTGQMLDECAANTGGSCALNPQNCGCGGC